MPSKFPVTARPALRLIEGGGARERELDAMLERIARHPFDDAIWAWAEEVTDRHAAATAGLVIVREETTPSESAPSISPE